MGGTETSKRKEKQISIQKQRKKARRIVYKKLIRQQVDIDEMQFSFMPRCEITNFIYRRNIQQEKKNLYFAFVDFEKAFDRVSRDFVLGALRKVDAEEWLVKIVQSMYRNGQSHFRANGTFSDDFLVQVRLHQGSMLSPFCFITVLEALSREIKLGCPELLYSDDMAQISWCCWQKECRQ